MRPGTTNTVVSHDWAVDNCVLFTHTTLRVLLCYLCCHLMYGVDTTMRSVSYYNKLKRSSKSNACVAELYNATMTKLKLNIASKTRLCNVIDK